MSERRYSDDEVSEIFARATEVQHADEGRHGAPRELSPGEGFTLAELKEIGREAGIDPAQVERAARSLDRPRGSTALAPRTPSFMGVKLGVSHTVELPYRMSDARWERLVMDLRDTFDAAGHVHSDGNFRQWRNGNLRVLVEPDGEGSRVRMRTEKGSARSLMTAGMMMAVVSLVMIVMGVVFPGSVGSQFGTLFFSGAALFAVGAGQVPRWARLRKSQMKEIGDRLLAQPEP